MSFGVQMITCPDETDDNHTIKRLDPDNDSHSDVTTAFVMLLPCFILTKNQHLHFSRKQAYNMRRNKSTDAVCVLLDAATVTTSATSEPYVQSLGFQQVLIFRNYNPHYHYHLPPLLQSSGNECLKQFFHKYVPLSRYTLAIVAQQETQELKNLLTSIHNLLIL